jgi:hypothetical protein
MRNDSYTFNGGRVPAFLDGARCPRMPPRPPDDGCFVPDPAQAIINP